MVFPIVMYGCEKAEHQRIHVFKLQCWRILLKIPWTARRSNQPILKDINPEYPLEGLMLKLKLQYFGHLIWRAIGKDPDAGKDWGQEEKGETEDEMMDGITNSLEMRLNKFQELVEDREAWCATVHEVAKSQTQLSDWTTASYLK